ncbi:MAG: isoprenylcysteine carboxylmethyltransferase family protein [Phycisphaeraceae bacterium]|nr:isoprenylcysteine carboxylmethyltransferase family protein [Phycisphaeraceae bacterium]
MAAYLLFFVTFLYAIGFVGNWGVAKSIDAGTPGAIGPSLLINALLLTIFVVQHTIMARPAFKRWWTTVIPAAIERSTFVIAASLSLLAVFLFWQPLPQTVWSVEHPLAAGTLVALSLAGWGLVLVSSFVINHFDLFGLRQVWLRFMGRSPSPVGFRLRGPYRLVRHPLMVGFLVAFWATPHMSVGHLFFAIMTSGYIFMGIWFEERDLVAEHGEDYLDYRRRVRALLPIPRRA